MNTIVSRRVFEFLTPVFQYVACQRLQTHSRSDDKGVVKYNVLLYCRHVVERSTGDVRFRRGVCVCQKSNAIAFRSVLLRHPGLSSRYSYHPMTVKPWV